MAEKIFKEKFGNIKKIKICTTTADLNFDNYTEPGTYEIYEDMGSGQSRIYLLTVDKSVTGACLKQTRIHCGIVDARQTDTAGAWSDWVALSGGGSVIGGASNLKNGEGLGAVIQYIESEENGVVEEDGNVYYPKPVASGVAAVAMGRYTEALGNHSAAFNYDTVASGSRAFACGQASLASALASFAANKGQAIADRSSAFGTSTASAPEAFATGSGTTASGEAAFSSGKQNEANGGFSFVTGYGNVVTGEYAQAGGLANEVSGEAASSGGKENVVSGARSYAGGRNNNVTGIDSFIYGRNCESASNFSLMCGSNNKSKGGQTLVAGANNEAVNNYQTIVGIHNAPASTDLFEIGCGASAEAKANVFSVDRRGIVRIGATHYGTNSGVEPTLQIGSVSLTETQLKALLELIG